VRECINTFHGEYFSLRRPFHADEFLHSDVILTAMI